MSSTRNILRVSRPTPYSSSESAVPLQVLSGCSECSVVSFGYSGNSELRTSDFELRTSNRPISTLCLPAGLFKQAIHSFSLALRTKIPPLRSKSKPTPEIRAQCRVSGLTLEFGEQSDETKTLFLGHSGAARGRWIVARLSAWHANALQQTSTAIDSETTPGPDSNRKAALLCPGFPDAADSWSKRWPESGNSTAQLAPPFRIGDLQILLPSNESSSLAGARPRRVAGRVWPCAITERGAFRKLILEIT